MPVQHTYGTVGATGGGFSSFRGLQPLFREEHGNTRPGYTWQRRSLASNMDVAGWSSLWSRGGVVGGAGVQGYAVDAALGHGYGPFSCGGPGNQTKRFIRGITKDSVGNPLSGVIVQGFVTSDDRYVGQDVSRGDGTYTLGTETVPGVQHYLVAYLPGSPDRAGTTVNTLTSTLVDGS